MTIDPQKLVSRLWEIADRYADERANKKSVARTIAKAKQEAILEAIREVELVANVDEPPNPWRYFHEPWNCAVVRVRRDANAWRYYVDGDQNCEIEDADQCRLEYWDSWIKLSNTSLHELTEAEAVAILGGKRPWDVPQGDHQFNREDDNDGRGQGSYRERPCEPRNHSCSSQWHIRPLEMPQARNNLHGV